MKRVQILIRWLLMKPSDWLLMKPSDLDLHCFLKGLSMGAAGIGLVVEIIYPAHVICYIFHKPAERLR